MIAFQPADPDKDSFDALLRESLSEGHAMLQRLQDNWHNGTNRFSKPGEILIGAFDGSRLLGLCGRSIDPYGDNPQAGRVRHLYVAQSHRHRGIGRLLVASIVEGAAAFFDHLNARAPQSAFPFYEHLGFMRIANDPFVTHRLDFRA